MPPCSAAPPPGEMAPSAAFPVPAGSAQAGPAKRATAGHRAEPPLPAPVHRVPGAAGPPAGQVACPPAPAARPTAALAGPRGRPDRGRRAVAHGAASQAAAPTEGVALPSAPPPSRPEAELGSACSPGGQHGLPGPAISSTAPGRTGPLCSRLGPPLPVLIRLLSPVPAQCLSSPQPPQSSALKPLGLEERP